MELRTAELMSDADAYLVVKYGLRVSVFPCSVTYWTTGSRTKPKDQVTGEDVDWMLPRLSANAKTVNVLQTAGKSSGCNPLRRYEGTYGEIGP